MPRYNALAGKPDTKQIVVLKKKPAANRAASAAPPKPPAAPAAAAAPRVAIPVATIAQLVGTTDRTLAEATSAAFEKYRATHPALADWRAAWRHFSASQVENFESGNEKMPQQRPGNVIDFPKPVKTDAAAADFLSSL